MRALIFGLIVLLSVAHQDFWWRYDHQTLVLGFIPLTLAYHIGVSIAASVLWGLACVYCWPRGADVIDPGPDAGPRTGGH